MSYERFYTLSTLSFTNREKAPWSTWLDYHPKDFLDTSALWVSIVVNAFMAFLTFQLYRANRSQIRASNQQSNRILLGQIFEEAIEVIDLTVEMLMPIYTEIHEDRDLYIRIGAGSPDKAKELKSRAMTFGLRLELYSLDNVNTSYGNWLKVVIEILEMVEEIERKSHMGSYGTTTLDQSLKMPYVEKSDELFSKLKETRNSVLKSMADIVKVDLK